MVWISTAERLPFDGEVVLVATREILARRDYPQGADFIGGEFYLVGRYWEGKADCTIRDVLIWHPLPELPR